MKKFLIFLICGILIFTLSIVPGSYSYYSKTFSKNAFVNAATKEEIIESFEIEGSSPPTIKIKKAEDTGYNPRVYFDVAGDASKYILNISPVTLTDDTVYYTIPLNINVSLSQFIDLVNASENSISGRIKLSYLNGYVSIEKDFSISREYLIEIYKNALGIPPGNERDELLSKTILYTASQRSWNSIEQDAKNPPELDENQIAIINKVSPGLLNYIDLLISEIAARNREISDRNSEIERLNSQINNLNVQINELSREPASENNLSESTTPEVPQ